MYSTSHYLLNILFILTSVFQFCGSASSKNPHNFEKVPNSRIAKEIGDNISKQNYVIGTKHKKYYNNNNNNENTNNNEYINNNNMNNNNNNMNNNNNNNMTKSCYPQRVLKNRIIKSNQSIRSGAAFIFSIKTENKEECVKYCCEHSKCNTVVVKMVSGSTASCYMFDCLDERVCSYDRHGSFQTLEIVNYYQKNAPNYNNNNNNKDDKALDIEKNIEKNINKDMPNNNNNNFDNNKDNNDNNNKNNNDDGFCKPGFHRVKNACRKDCPSSLYFECLNTQQPELQQCIAVYDVCDGYRQCIDASDEKNCSAAAAGMNNVNNNEGDAAVTMSPNQKVVSTHDNKNNKSVDDKQNQSKDDSNHHQQNHPIKNSTHVDQNHAYFNKNPSHFNNHPAHLSDNYRKNLQALQFNAMLALTLGTLASFIGLIFLLHRIKGCYKHSLSRSKVKHQDDYLINGLYL